MAQADKALALEMFNAGEKATEVVKALADKVSRGTVYRWHKEWQADGR